MARGEIIEQAALTQALQAGWIAGAGLDVYTGEFTGPPPEELWQLPNVVITPHTSGGTGCPAGQGPGLVLRESGALRQRPSPPECLGLGAGLLKRSSGTDSSGNGPVPRQPGVWISEETLSPADVSFVSLGLCIPLATHAQA